MRQRKEAQTPHLCALASTDRSPQITNEQNTLQLSNLLIKNCNMRARLIDEGGTSIEVPALKSPHTAISWQEHRDLQELASQRGSVKGSGMTKTHQSPTVGHSCKSQQRGLPTLQFSIYFTNNMSMVRQLADKFHVTG